MRAGDKEGMDAGAIIAAIDTMILQHEARSKLRGFRGSVASGSFASDTEDASALEEAVKRASARNIHFAIGAGNDKKDACDISPARLSKDSNIVTVGAINFEDRRSKFSNFGSCVTVYAPGESIVTTGIGSRAATNVKRGTSMACPHISGLMAVFLAQDESLRFDPGKMKRKIIGMAQKVKLELGRSIPGDPGLVATNGKRQ